MNKIFDARQNPTPSVYSFCVVVCVFTVTGSQSLPTLAIFSVAYGRPSYILMHGISLLWIANSDHSVSLISKRDPGITNFSIPGLRIQSRDCNHY